jgi:adenylylsulfate kinase-like enzyme
VDDPYEPPDVPELVVETATMPVGDAAAAIVSLLEPFLGSARA